MTDQAVSPLRRRMIEDMTICKFTPKTQYDYVQRIKNFAAFLGRSPDTASLEDVRRYQLHLATSGVGVPTINQTVSTLRFFFKVTLGRREIVEHTHAINELRKLPVVLSPEEVARLLNGASGLKYKAALIIRRFLIHVLPKGLHRVGHYGLFAKSACADNIARARSSRSPLLNRPRQNALRYRQSPQIVRQLEELDTTRRSFINRFTLKPLVASVRFRSTRSPAALKSP